MAIDLTTQRRGLSCGAVLRENSRIAGQAAIEMRAGFYVQASGAWLGDVKLDRIGRASAYVQTGDGKTKGNGWAASGEAGWRVPVGRFSVTPYAAIDYTDLKFPPLQSRYRPPSRRVSAATQLARSMALPSGSRASR